MGNKCELWSLPLCRFSLHTQTFTRTKGRLGKSLHYLSLPRIKKSLDIHIYSVELSSV